MALVLTRQQQTRDEEIRYPLEKCESLEIITSSGLNRASQVGFCFSRSKEVMLISHWIVKRLITGKQY